MEERDITVVIPAYNEEKYIETTLQNLRKQNYKNYRIIVVDNNSKDKTVEIAEKYADEVLHETRQGAGYARYRGIESAKSTIIASADADSIYPPDWLSRINEALQGDVVGCAGRILAGHPIH
ncbi:MAG: glycosyltransferase family A protein, partial [Candidatus Altiarchaeota archaeon]|nr:glycosyltransferase family A protein [Candidatus Altiarchaeota archaeon]